MEILEADPGFPPQGDFAKFSEKLHEIEKILVRGGAPLISATEYGSLILRTDDILASAFPIF